jgi:hypothetical protein
LALVDWLVYIILIKTFDYRNHLFLAAGGPEIGGITKGGNPFPEFEQEPWGHSVPPQL